MRDIEANLSDSLETPMPLVDNASYVLMLSFMDKNEAERWASDHGFNVRFKVNSRTFVVRMDEQEEQDEASAHPS